MPIFKPWKRCASASYWRTWWRRSGALISCWGRSTGRELQIADRRIADLNAKSEELRKRTKAFAVRIIKLFQALPHGTAAQVVGKQLLRCGTSVGANYRAACRARSKAEFVAKLGIVLEECDETVYCRSAISKFSNCNGNFRKTRPFLHREDA
ncbi:MAG: four helix bundle protein [Acidobacteriales bacterium]|nr:four helix bundle protein [Terriglobales bacterium]